MTKHILIAEDDARDADALCAVLQSVGIQIPVTVVDDGEQAVAYLNGEGQFADREKFPLPSVLLLDLRMPRADGFEVLEWLMFQPQLSRMLIVSVSGGTNTPEVMRSYQLGSHTFLTKPIRPEDITQLVLTFPGFWTSPDLRTGASLVAQTGWGLM